MKIALAQINPTVGDLAGNRKLVEESADKAVQAGADLVVMPEMVLTGYPPMDLLERDGFVRDQLRELDALLPASKRIPIALGAVLRETDRQEGRGDGLINAGVLLADGKQVYVQAKTLLPSYDVFDEKRHFAPAAKRGTVLVQDTTLGIATCEDSWFERIPYDINPVEEMVREGAALILNPSASPWHAGKAMERRQMLVDLARNHQVAVIFVNQVGGNDELIFDGGSFATDPSGRISGVLPSFESGMSIVEISDGRLCADDGEGDPGDILDDMEIAAQLEAGLALGIRDYFQKQRLPPGAVIGLSGGIDSAVTAHLAVKALGADRVLGIAMPGPYSSEHSVEDAHELGKMLGIEVREVSISPIYEAYRTIFADLFGKRDDYGLTQQNIQSRIRGAILMAVSNQEGRLVLATGNKSELSVGYCTLYGDTVGGLCVLGDVYKRDVYAIARHANRERPQIPENTISKPPSAELAADQLDSDDLPDYDVLDDILEQCIEGERGAAGVRIPKGCSVEVAEKTIRRLDLNEYKRRQAPLILRTTAKAFGTGRRMPIVHRYTR
ncbi:MAG: NAD+ synthase [Deltaproteobacteria bacterium]|nr:NAD+ synthase [Deltaproteobacteria bacterium]